MRGNDASRDAQRHKASEWQAATAQKDPPRQPAKKRKAWSIVILFVFQIMSSGIILHFSIVGHIWCVWIVHARTFDSGPAAETASASLLALLLT